MYDVWNKILWHLFCILLKAKVSGKANILDNVYNHTMEVLQGSMAHMHLLLDVRQVMCKNV